jgi:hypothetical protein
MMARQSFPTPHGSPTPAGWSLLLPSWAAAPSSRPRRSSTLGAALSRIVRVFRDRGRLVCRRVPQG